MFHQIAVHNTPAIHSTPAPRRLSQAPSIAMQGPELSEPAFNQVMLDYLNAVSHSFQSAPDLDQAIRLPVVLNLSGIAKSTWYARLNPRSKTFDPRAPQPFKLGTSKNSPSVWWRSAVMAYLKACANTPASC